MAYRSRKSYGFTIPGTNIDLPSGVDPSNPATLISSIEIASNYTPAGLSFNPSGALDSSGAPSPYAAAIQAAQPKFIVHFKAGIPDYAFAPYGNPGPTQWPTIATVAEIAGMGLVGLLAFSVVSILKKKKVV